VIKPAYSVSFLLSINIFVWQNLLYFPNDLSIKQYRSESIPVDACDVSHVRLYSVLSECFVALLRWSVSVVRLRVDVCVVYKSKQRIHFASALLVY